MRWQVHPRVTWSVSRGSEDTSLGSQDEQSAGIPLAAKWRAGSVFRRRLEKATKPLDDRCQPESLCEADTVVKVWTKKQQVVSLSTAESELYAAVQDRIRMDWGSRVWQRIWEIACGLNLQLDASATMCLVNRRGLGKAKHVDMQNLWMQEACKSDRFVTKKFSTSVNATDLVTKPLPKPKVEQLMNIMGYELMRSETNLLKCQSARTSMTLQISLYLLLDT